MRVKLLSAWFGPKPPWYSLFVEQMKRFQMVDWECVPPFDGPHSEQADWMNKLVTERLGVACRKGAGVDDNSVCDLRPAYGEIFADKYEGYDWWGWCDLDMLFGDMDKLLQWICLPEVNVVTFKREYLSGCLTLLRNTPFLKRVYRLGRYWEVFGDTRYHCWDESGYHYFGPKENFFNVLRIATVRVNYAPDLYCYETKQHPNPVELKDGRLVELKSGDEKLFCHFMSDRWPIKSDGTSIYA